MISEPIRSAAWEACKTHQIPLEWLLSVILIESAGKPFKTRYEPKWAYWKDVDLWAKHLGVTEDTERHLQSFSWGLCQLMGSVLRELGFSLDMPEACDIKINTFYGAKKLAQLHKKYNNELDVISAYNAGVPVKDKEGTYRNNFYVAKYMLAKKSLEKG